MSATKNEEQAMEMRQKARDFSGKLFEHTERKWKEAREPALILENKDYTDQQKVQQLLYHKLPQALEILDREWKAGRLRCDIQTVHPATIAGYKWAKEQGLDILSEKSQFAGRSYMSAMLILFGSDKDTDKQDVVIAMINDGLKADKSGKFKKDCEDYFESNKEALERLGTRNQKQQKKKNSNSNTRSESTSALDSEQLATACATLRQHGMPIKDESVEYDQQTIHQMIEISKVL